MKCLKCQKEITSNLTVAEFNKDRQSIEVTVDCNHCRAEHFVFVDVSEFILSDLD